MERRIAVVDLGSNTCRLAVFAVSPGGSFHLEDQVSERARIGEGMFTENRLQPEPIKRTLQLLKMFAELCRKHEIDRVAATATSAVRDAENREEFLACVQHETGLTLRVLSGEEEAYYAYLGVVNSLPLRDGVVADLGGGSLELVQVRDRMPRAIASLPLGAVRLYEQFLCHDPIRPRERNALQEYIVEQLSAIKWLAPAPGQELVVLGGSARAIARIDQAAHGYPLDRLHAYELRRSRLRAITEELLDQPLKGRRKIEGLPAERADVLPAGATVIYWLAKQLGIKSLTLSGQGLREGVFYEQLLTDLAAQSESIRVLVPRGPGLALPPGIDAVPLIPHVATFSLANLSSRYDVDWPHSLYVLDLALALFDQLESLHGYGAEERRLLGAAAVLHDSGIVIDFYRHHRHSAYLVENADLPGYTHREIAIIALLTRWHRRGKPDVEPFRAVLGWGDIERVDKLAALLRLAEDLERGRVQAVSALDVRVFKREVVIRLSTLGGAEVEAWAANRKTDLFETAYGRALRVIAEPPSEGTRSPDAVRTNILERSEQLAAKLGDLR